MTLEYLKEQKEKYEKKMQYFSAIDFSNLASDFQGVVDLIEKMEEYIKENNSEQISEDINKEENV
jgi:CRISPR/Cas system CSM-associated protein Csm4 (group 5 of RAMP superfamily)